MYSLIGAARIIALIVIMLIGLVFGLLSMALPANVMPRLSTLWHSLVTSVVGVRCHYSGSRFRTGALLVSNHISWLDISVIGSRVFVVFLAKSEIAGWPILGWLVKMAGTLFIKRGEGSQQALKELTDSLHSNRSVLIFPEGKTTDGSTLARFQPRLFQSAIDCGAVVQPVAIRYVDKSSARIDRMSFHGEIGFLESLWSTVCGNIIHAEVFVFEPISPETDRDSISHQAENQIRSWVDSELKPSNSS
jgi:1-acyl-sn-glycerol-3-phosphate acyltransferase